MHRNPRRVFRRADVEGYDFLRVGPINRSDLDTRNGARCVRVRVSNIAAADETDVDCHSLLISGMGYAIQETVMNCIQSQKLRLVPGGGIEPPQSFRTCGF